MSVGVDFKRWSTETDILCHLSFSRNGGCRLQPRKNSNVTTNHGLSCFSAGGEFSPGTILLVGYMSCFLSAGWNAEFNRLGQEQNCQSIVPSTLQWTHGCGEFFTWIRRILSLGASYASCALDSSASGLKPRKRAASKPDDRASFQRSNSSTRCWTRQHNAGHMIPVTTSVRCNSDIGRASSAWHDDSLSKQLTGHLGSSCGAFALSTRLSNSVKSSCPKYIINRVRPTEKPPEEYTEQEVRTHGRIPCVPRPSGRSLFLVCWSTWKEFHRTSASVGHFWRETRAETNAVLLREDFRSRKVMREHDARRRRLRAQVWIRCDSDAHVSEE